MHNSCRYRNCAITLLLAAIVLGLIPCHQALAQSKPGGAGKSPLCTRDNALDMIRQQVDLTRTFTDTTRRITVLIRAADLLWPYQQNKGRAVFKEAFELATENEKENESTRPRSLLLRLQIPDQRYLVITAVARRDFAFAQELTRQILKAVNDSEGSSTRSSFEKVVTADRLLDSANKLIGSDLNAALDLARISLGYPGGFMLTHFLYKLAGVNQQAADQLYAQALSVYGDKPMREFLYLQAYPFGWTNTLNTPIFSFYQVPANFVPNQSLQRRFVQAILRRAQQALEAPSEEVDTYQNNNGTWTPGAVHLLEGVVRLEPQVRASLPDLLAPIMDARDKLLVSLSAENQKLFLQPGREISTTPDQTFAERLGAAQKLSDVYERDESIATAVLSDASEKETLADVIEAIDKISDSSLRAYLLEWLSFQRVTTAINGKQFEEAERLTSRIEGLEQRAHLHTQLAKGLLNRSDTQTHAREVLDEAISEAKKAGVTIFAARTLLTASTLYAKIDLGRAISVLAEAINCINRLEAPDFVSDGQTLEERPERRGRAGQFKGHYVFRFYMPGLDPDSAFREMAKIDFDTSLAQSSGLTDKFQRSMSTLALADVCLQQEPPNKKPKK